ncbi:MAG TPA: DUF58 domain-containing protein [Polyangia bacterium]
MASLRARLRRWFRPPRKFRLTREGKWFIGATLVLGFAAVNGGINLLFLMFGMLLCLLVANGVLAEASMRHLAPHRQLPHAIYAGSPFLMGIAVRNHKSRIATFSLEVEDLSADRNPVDRRCFFLKIPAHRRQETSYRRTLSRRGIHRLTGLRMSTRFPFGLLRRSIDVEAPADLLVYPALIPVSDLTLRAGLSQLGEKQTAARARSGEFHGLRELRPGDDPSSIHWRTSARRGRHFVREFEEEAGRTVVIVLKTAVEPDAGEAFETAVSYAASLALVLIRRGLRVGLVAGAFGIAPETGGSQGGQILRALALVEPAANNQSAGEGPAWAGHGATTLTVVPEPGRPRVEVGTGMAMRRIS